MRWLADLLELAIVRLQDWWDIVVWLSFLHNQNIIPQGKQYRPYPLEGTYCDLNSIGGGDAADAWRRALALALADFASLDPSSLRFYYMQLYSLYATVLRYIYLMIFTGNLCYELYNFI